MVKYSWGYLMRLQVVDNVLLLWPRVCAFPWFEGSRRYSHSRWNSFLEGTYKEGLGLADF